jgi:hypothetical protein
MQHAYDDERLFIRRISDQVISHRAKTQWPRS